MNKRKILVLLLLVIASQQLGSAGYIKAKAHLAQILIGRAWEETLASNGERVKPWPWADTWPVARLEVPKHAVDLFVLAGATGNALAFGPGHDSRSAIPGGEGVTVIGGHRDTHFAFLDGIKANTLLSLQLPSGQRKAYRINAIRIVDTNREPHMFFAGGVNELQLVTCYPFDALQPGGPLRYVVSATPLASASSFSSTTSFNTSYLFATNSEALEL